jgi:quercetin 2,3-dioxygenase
MTAVDEAGTALNPIAAVPITEGAGFQVRRALPTSALEAVGPFIFLDHFGPIHIRPGEVKGAPEHPHAGIETITYLLEGRNRHRDSLGNVSSVGPGEVQWMRAGRGIVHEEGPDDELAQQGGRMHGFQFWINLPVVLKRAQPAYRQFAARELPRIERDGASLTVIAGQVAGRLGPLKSIKALQLCHLHMKAGARFEIDIVGPEAAMYVAAGVVSMADVRLSTGTLLPLSGRSSIICFAETDSDVILLGGEPLDAPILRYGPFVMNSQADLAQATREYQTGLMGRIGRQGGH